MKGLCYCLYIIVIILVSGCVAAKPWQQKDENQGVPRFSCTYDPMVENKLNLNGYYYLDKPHGRNRIILYPDGTYFMFYLADELEYNEKTVAIINNRIKPTKTYKVDTINNRLIKISAIENREELKKKIE